MEIPPGFDTITCPACGKKAAVPAKKCGRCASSLERLSGILTSAVIHLEHGWTFLLDKQQPDPASALRHAESSWGLRHSKAAITLGGIAAVNCQEPSHIALWQKRHDLYTGS